MYCIAGIDYTVTSPDITKFIHYVSIRNLQADMFSMSTLSGSFPRTLSPWVLMALSLFRSHSDGLLT
jgi:hypothetical protein